MNKKALKIFENELVSITYLYGSGSTQVYGKYIIIENNNKCSILIDDTLLLNSDYLITIRKIIDSDTEYYSQFVPWYFNI